MASPNANVPNIYAYRGRHLLSQYHARYKNIPPHKLSRMKRVLRSPATTPNLPVCIIGAGAAGLYTAMILESLGISYQLVDGDPNGRVGGRLFTYQFPGGGKYDYYDVGAMRFPNTPFMKRTFNLADKLSLTLIPYIMQMVQPSPNTYLFFNGSRVNNQDGSITGDPFNVSSYLNDPSLTTPEEVSNKVATVIQPFRDFFRVSSSGVQPKIKDAMDELFTATNVFSMRSYMFQLGMDAKAISWCETLDKSTGWYDRALTETVIESLAFHWPTAPLPGPEPPISDPNAGWKCFDGGSSTLPNAMYASLTQGNVLLKSPVTAISEDTTNNCMNISINGTPSPQSYSAVISTVPLPRLSLMDLTGVDLPGPGVPDNYGQWSAIRELQYGPAIKVGIKFNCPWWETELSPPIHGGQSYTDLPLRTVVYPSYPPDTTGADVSPVLIVSYCWTQDAERMGALINRDGTGQPELIDLVLRDLAAVHGVTVDWLNKYYTASDENYFAWNWLQDPLTMGGYAFFGPGVYGSNDIYSEMLLTAANNKLFFAGEATSACHAWVAGALDSAWRAVYQYLSLYQPESVMQAFYNEWGSSEYWDETSDEALVEQNRELMERHLVIALHKSGVRLPKEEDAEAAAV